MDTQVEFRNGQLVEVVPEAVRPLSEEEVIERRDKLNGQIASLIIERDAIQEIIDSHIN